MPCAARHRPLEGCSARCEFGQRRKGVSDSWMLNGCKIGAEAVRRGKLRNKVGVDLKVSLFEHEHRSSWVALSAHLASAPRGGQQPYLLDKGVGNRSWDVAKCLG